MTMDDFIAEFAEAPNAEGYIGEDFWESVFDDIDDPEELRNYLLAMEQMGSADITWRDDDIPEEAWLSGY